MWLELNHSYSLIRDEPEDCVVRWRADLVATVDYDRHDPGQPEEFVVGRILADEIRRYEIEEWGESAWDVADADSSGLESAYAGLLHEEGKFCSDLFDSLADPIVYLYRFELHADFAAWRMPLLDAFCRQFGGDAIILAQYHTTWLSVAEFKHVGFKLLEPSKAPTQGTGARNDRDVRFMVRDNTNKTPISVNDYPTDCPPASAEHERWVESKGPWKGLM